MTAGGGRSRVVIAGAGVAALEALAGLAKRVGDRAQLTLVAPDPSFGYRPASTARPFSLGPERELPIGDIARDMGAHVVRDTVVLVDEPLGKILTHDGDAVPFDALLLAVGTQLTWPREDGIHWGRGEESARAFAALLAEVEREPGLKVGLIVPEGVCWPVDAYELALILAAGARADGGTQISLVTSEARPLEALGRLVSDAIAGEVERSGVKLTTETPDAGGLPFDRVLSIPASAGIRLSGVPRGAAGLIHVAADSRVQGMERVWAVGDCTASVLKHASVAVRQSDAAVEGITAAITGASPEGPLPEPRLHGVFVLPGRSLSGSIWVRPGEPLTHCLWWPPGRAAGAHLAPYLSSRDPAVRRGVVWHPHGLPVDVPVAQLGARDAPVTAAAPDEEAFGRDALNRDLLALARLEREAARRERTLERGLRELERRQREVVAQLEAAGYLHHDIKPG